MPTGQAMTKDLPKARYKAMSDHKEKCGNSWIELSPAAAKFKEITEKFHLGIWSTRETRPGVTYFRITTEEDREILRDLKSDEVKTMGGMKYDY